MTGSDLIQQQTLHPMRQDNPSAIPPVSCTTNPCQTPPAMALNETLRQLLAEIRTHPPKSLEHQQSWVILPPGAVPVA